MPAAVEKNAEYFRQRTRVDPDTGCMLWQLSCWSNGYGQACGENRRRQSAHRLSWEAHVGPIPDGLCVLHKCDVRSCVNPDHLFLGTQLDNIKDMHRKGRQVNPDNHGALNQNATLTEAQVKAVYTGKESTLALVKKLGVGPSAINRIKNGFSWGSLTRELQRGT